MSTSARRGSAGATGSDNPAPLRVAIGEFAQLVSLGLWVVLRQDQGLSIAGVDLGEDELVLLAGGKAVPAAVILDGARLQAATLRRLRDAAPHAGLLALVPRGRRDAMRRLLQAGVTECLSIDARPAEIRAAVRRVANAGDLRERLLGSHGPRPAAPTPARLTQREREVLSLLADGNSTATMALTLQIAEATVDTHVKNIRRKLGVRSSAEVRGLALGAG